MNDGAEGSIGEGILTDVTVERFDGARVMSDWWAVVEGCNVVAEGREVANDVPTDES